MSGGSSFSAFCQLSLSIVSPVLDSSALLGRATAATSVATASASAERVNPRIVGFPPMGLRNRGDVKQFFARSDNPPSGGTQTSVCCGAPTSGGAGDPPAGEKRHERGGI